MAQLLTRCFGYNLDIVKPTLIDSNPEMETRRKRKQRERLSEKTPKGDAIVRTTQKYELCEANRNDWLRRKTSNKAQPWRMGILQIPF